MGSQTEYDLVIIGSGPGGQKAAVAVQARQVGSSDRTGLDARRRVRQHGHDPVENTARSRDVLTGMSQRELYGAGYRVKENITTADLQPAPPT